MNWTLIENLIRKHEGVRNSVYTDSQGHLTIGIGWNLDDPDAAFMCSHFGLYLPDLRNGTMILSDAQIEEVFDYQVRSTISSAMKLLPNFLMMPDEVQAAVCDMVFNLGEPKFAQFHVMIAALSNGDWKGAAAAAGDSLWARQVPNRAKDDISILEAA